MQKSLFIIIISLCLNAEAQSSALSVADSLYSHGNYSKAIEAYKSLDNQEGGYVKIARSYIALGNFDAALTNYEKAAEVSPENALLKFEYAKFLTNQKKYQLASKLFNDLIYLDYKNPNYHYEMGVVLEKMNDSTSYNRFYSAYNLDDTHQKAIFKLAKHHLIKRHHDVSHRYIDKGLESYANNVELVNLKAQNYYYQNYYRKAITWFEELLELGESSEFIHEKLSICYAEYSEFEKAIEHRKKLLEFNPNDLTSMYVIGSYYEKLNDFENAELYISNYLDKKDVQLHHEYRLLGTIYNRQKNYEAAIKAFQKALKENPSDMFSEFYIIRTKDEYYADIDSKIKLYEDFLKKHQNDTPFKVMAVQRLAQLRDEKFLKDD
ncbi:tetratricopeptide repeat protein [Winogradskyella sp. A3E31]|uniref:tetratricopeptide repeat protein n=1 Tax=Winogradskyella sp. A3E31 TaxID=3349637 RepID=UPI00398B3A6C